MSKLPVVLLADPNPIIKNRIKSILSNQDIRFYEVSNRLDIINAMAENDNQVNLIISEIELDVRKSFDGISLIRLVREKNTTVPVVILTSISRKEVIMKCLLEGAADYILKPFADEYLKEKVLKYIDIDSLTEYTVLKFNLRNFLSGEIHKAQKGCYNFSLLMVNFRTLVADDLLSIKNGFYKHAETIYKDLKSLFWESDLYIQHGSQCHLGFFPFCDEGQTKVIRSKILTKFEQMKTDDPALQNYSILLTSSTYPIDGSTASDLLSVLTERANTN